MSVSVYILQHSHGSKTRATAKTPSNFVYGAIGDIHPAATGGHSEPLAGLLGAAAARHGHICPVVVGLLHHPHAVQRLPACSKYRHEFRYVRVGRGRVDPPQSAVGPANFLDSARSRARRFVLFQRVLHPGERNNARL